MHDLTLIGVHEDGQHLLLADSHGERFRLPLDDALRAAARRDRPRLGQLQIEIEGGLRPRDVQSLIRAGASAEEVADRSGWTIEKVRKFEGPILAEREYIANRARATSIAKDGAPVPTLQERAQDRFRSRGVDLREVGWDAHRQESGQWIVTVAFPAGGRERTASWKFDVATGLLRAQNDDARWIGEDDGVGGVPVPHVVDSTRPGDEVFDVTALRPGQPRAQQRPRPTPEPEVATEDELTSSIRAHHSQIRDRRGRRRSHPTEIPGSQTLPTDAIPLQPLAFDLESVEPPPARPRQDRSAEPTTAPPQSPEQPVEAERPQQPVLPGHPEPIKQADQGEPATDPQTSASAARRGRPRVPTWEDVVLGARTRAPSPDDEA